MSEAVAEKPATQATGIPQFVKIPEAQMAKARSYNSVSKEVQRIREVFDSALKSLKPGEAIRAPLTFKDGQDDAKSIRMNLSHASERTGIKIDAVVTDSAVEFKLAKQA